MDMDSPHPGTGDDGAPHPGPLSVAQQPCRLQAASTGDAAAQRPRSGGAAPPVVAGRYFDADWSPRTGKCGNAPGRFGLLGKHRRLKEKEGLRTAADVVVTKMHEEPPPPTMRTRTTTTTDTGSKGNHHQRVPPPTARATTQQTKMTRATTTTNKRDRSRLHPSTPPQPNHA